MKCPNCECEIKRFDLAPNCKNCGVHIMYFTQEEDLKRDAKKTELEFANARYLKAKLKAAFIDGKLPIMRMVLAVLSVASLVLPVFNLSISLPWWSYELSVGAIGVYSLIADSFLGALLSLPGLGIAKTLSLITIASYVLLLVTALLIVGALGAWILSFINIRRSAKVQCVFSCLGALTALANTVLSFIALNISGGFAFIGVKPMFGGILTLVMLSIFFAVNLVIAYSEPDIYVTKADMKRIEISKEIKKGTLDIDSLPLPVVEEDKKKEEKEKKGKKKAKSKKRGKK